MDKTVSSIWDEIEIVGKNNEQNSTSNSKKRNDILASLGNPSNHSQRIGENSPFNTNEWDNASKTNQIASPGRASNVKGRSMQNASQTTGQTNKNQIFCDAILGSSIYYGAPDSSFESSHSIIEGHNMRKKDDENSSENSASRGNWWQGNILALLKLQIEALAFFLLNEMVFVPLYQS